MKTFQTLLTLAGVSFLVTACSTPTQKDPPFAGIMNRQDVNLSAEGLAPEHPLNMMGITSLWNRTSGKNPDGSRVVVALVGTGIDYNVPDLREALYVNTGELGTKSDNGLDDDGNGVEDDLFGYDFYTGDSKPFDWHGHDTYTASIIAATGRKVNGVRGVAPNSSILIARYIGPEGMANGFDAMSALSYAIATAGVKVIYFNWPQGGFRADPDMGDPNPLVVERIQAAAAKNILVVIPAGNSGSQEVPSFIEAASKLENVLVVGGVSTESGRLAKRSNFGKKYVSVAAPLDGGNGFFPGGVVSSDLNTTSVAAAYVAGAAALVSTLPGYGSAAKIKQAFLNNTVPGRGGELMDVLSEGMVSVSSVK